MPNTTEEKLELILQNQAAMNEWKASIERRMCDLEKLTESTHTLALATQAIAGKQEALSTSVTALQGDVDDLKAKPAKRWDALAGTLITVAATAFLTYLFTK